MLNYPCIPWINPTWSWWIIFLVYCWILLARILLRILASIFIRGIGLKFSFGRVSLPGLAFCFYFWKQLQKNRCYFFFESLVGFSREFTRSWALVFWEVFDDCFDLLTRYWSIQVVNFFLIQFWKFIGS